MTSNESLERQMESYLKENGIKYETFTNSTTELDFKVYYKDIPVFIEAKERSLPAKYSNWPMESYNESVKSFILDDLTIRKMISKGFYGYLLVWDKYDDSYYISTTVDIALMTNIKRCDRIISYKKRNGEYLLDKNNEKIPIKKGKCIIPFKYFYKMDDLDTAIKTIYRFVDNMSIWSTRTESYQLEKFDGDMKNYGTLRKKEYRTHDYNSTR